MKQKIILNMEAALARYLPHHSVREIYHYALFPPGKLFRPLLAISLFQDCQGSSGDEKDLLTLASALEFHHAYTLIHDDLPSMDNDDYRRGKLTVHKKFSEWQAILVGDGLLSLSYQLINSLNEQPTSLLIRRLFAHLLGPKGLIHGQILDLSLPKGKKPTLAELCTIHKLKTSRLITMAILGGALLAEEISAKKFKDFYRLGDSVGLIFQLLDDLQELGTKNFNPHEKEVNAFYLHNEETLSLLKIELMRIKTIVAQYELKNCKIILQSYLQQIRPQIEHYPEILPYLQLT